MRIAVTGGRGFLGRYVRAEAERRGHLVKDVDRHNGMDVLAPELVKWLRGADAVIHLAGMLGTHELFDRAEAAVTVNAVGTLRVLEACREVRAGYVGITMPESGWANVYTATKHCAQDLANAWHRNHGVPVSHVRAFNAYGPGQAHGPKHPQKVVPTFATHAWRGEPIPIWGAGDQTVDLVHARDVARMLLDATSFGDEEVFDAGTGRATSVLEVADRVCCIAGSTAEHRFLPMRRGEDPSTKIVASVEGWDLLGWRPTHDDAVFAEAVESYRPR